MSFIEQLVRGLYLKYVLKAAGVAGFALTLFHSWAQLSFLSKFGLTGSALAWLVGARFDKIYK